MERINEINSRPDHDLAVSDLILLGMEESGLSLKDLAKKSGISKSTVSRYSRGQTKRFTMNTICDIGFALGIKPERMVMAALNELERRQQERRKSE